MVYGAVSGNQTRRYPHVKEHYQTTKEHFHDSPNAKEPNKTSTFGLLYNNSTHFMDRRLDPKPVSRSSMVGGGATTLKFGQGESKPITWSGRLPESSYRGNGTFELANGLTYSYRSHKPVKLVPYASLTKSEYQANYNRTAQASEHPRWVTMRAPYSVDYKTTGRFNGTGGY
ncbi:hypothetical protein CHLRE_09g390949v5 [Chlamydomonas reinhardtii]|uniref:Uncharacterized protein n=1 Tax=Chlamydomonas reinhardtii TaxID=3055 RepID=A8J199_CHLRE|nr:uncharacterized protein CHLRE_09g390949v5 [Chlamydomonas reinhardtii]PNW78812.1 hypothetical protein CHLRE_09g390949v5 [Chlamydomonas reinhardtii]|eukprot:XP_001694947.1 flagellar associated protein [Chlamydomonas reinhardtii]